MQDDRHRVCPLEKAKKLDSFMRRFIHNPRRILKRNLKKGMHVLDFGCGPGMFAKSIAKMVEKKGKVYAVDLQKGMLDILKNKIKNSDLKKRIKLIQCKKNDITLKHKIDLALAFYVVHEIKDKSKFFKQVYKILKPKGLLYFIEPKKRVTHEEFKTFTRIAQSHGFVIVDKPSIFASHAFVFMRVKN